MRLRYLREPRRLFLILGYIKCYRKTSISLLSTKKKSDYGKYHSDAIDEPWTGAMRTLSKNKLGPILQNIETCRTR